jgi:hypothetical protein
MGDPSSFRNLATIDDADLGLGMVTHVSRATFTEQLAARVILFDDRIALLHVSKVGYHKLPRSCVKGDETLEEAARRGIAEERGCTVELRSQNVGRFGSGALGLKSDIYHFVFLTTLFRNSLRGEVQPLYLWSFLIAQQAD